MCLRRDRPDRRRRRPRDTALAAVDAAQALLIRCGSLPEMDSAGNVSGLMIDGLYERIESALQCEELDRGGRFTVDNPPRCPNVGQADRRVACGVCRSLGLSRSHAGARGSRSPSSWAGGNQ